MKPEAHLNLMANLPEPDQVYEVLINAHDGLTQSESAKLNAKLILLLINHIGDSKIIIEAIEKAK